MMPGQVLGVGAESSWPATVAIGFIVVGVGVVAFTAYKISEGVNKTLANAPGFGKSIFDSIF